MASKPQSTVAAPQAYTIKEFCQTHRVSPAKYYSMQLDGTGPDEMALGRKKLVSHEAATAWRREREQAAAAEAAPN